MRALNITCLKEWLLTIIVINAYPSICLLLCFVGYLFYRWTAL